MLTSTATVVELGGIAMLIVSRRRQLNEMLIAEQYRLLSVAVPNAPARLRAIG
jgi:hypothetical protein